MNLKKPVFVALSFFSFLGSFSQKPVEKVSTMYDPGKVFAQDFYKKDGNENRSANGAPGVKYWQNRADYFLDARLDTVKNELSCNEIITYINNSPDSLQSLWLQLDQNTYRQDARSNFYSVFGAKGHTEGFVIEAVEVTYSNGNKTDAKYIINDTRMQIRLPKALAPKEKILYQLQSISIRIPGAFGGRTDYFSTVEWKNL